MQKHYTVEEAQAELARLMGMDADLTIEVAELDRQIAELEGTAGERSLAARAAGDNGTLQEIHEDISRIRDTRNITEKTLMACRTAIVVAKREVNMAKARILRAQAGELNKEAKERQAITDRHLRELFEHEGIHYYPEPRSVGGAYIDGTIAESKTVKLAQEAVFLIRQAETMEQQVCRFEPDPSIDGRVSGLKAM